MDSNELLNELERQLASGQVSADQVRSRLQLPTAAQVTPANPVSWLQHVTIANIFYVIGGVIVLSGVIFLVAQVWDDLGAFSRIMITLGLGWLFTMLGLLLHRNTVSETISAVFYAIGGALLPGGVVIFLDEQSLDTDWGFAIAFLLVSLGYVLLLCIHRYALLTALAIINGVAALYLTADAALTPLLNGSELEVFFQYLTMVLGVNLIALGYAFREGWNKALVRLLYPAGSLAFLWAAFLRVPESVLWEWLYWVPLLGGLLLSTWLRSRLILTVSTIFVLVYVSYITFEYFADSIGWPVALVLLGFIFIGLGYMSISIGRTFMPGSQSTTE